MSNEFHKSLVDDDIHALTAETYADTTARDADSDFQVTTNIDKMVRVDSPVSYYILVSISPAIWVEATSTENDTLAEILAVGNTTDGTDLSVSTGDDITFADSTSAIFGDSADLTIQHNNTNSTIVNTTGNLEFQNTNVLGDIIFRLGTDTNATTVSFRNASDDTILIIEPQASGDLSFEGIQGDLTIGTNLGLFLFDDNSLHAGISAAEALQLGHTALAGFINSIGTGELQFQHDGVTLLTLSDTGKLSIPSDLSAPQFTIGENDDFQFFHNGTTSHIQNFVGDLKVTVVTGDMVVETTIDGHFLFTTNEFRAGVSTSEYLSIGHDGTDSFVNAVGDGTIQFQHEGTAIATLSDASVLNFPVETTISTTLGDITVSTGSGGEFRFGDDEFRAGLSGSEYIRIGHGGSNGFIDRVGDGSLFFQLGGATALTLDSAGGFTTGDLFSDDISCADIAATNIDAVKDVTAANFKLEDTVTFLDASTQSAAALPNLHNSRMSTAVLNQTFDVSTQDTQPEDVHFRPDGLKMYMTGQQNDNVNEYDLSTAWDISTATFLQSFSITTQDSSIRGITFKPDGLRMFVSGAENDRVYQYDLSTAWDVSTATFDDFVSVGNDVTNPHSAQFKADGKSFFIVGFAQGIVAEYVMTTAWDVSSASFSLGFLPSEPSTIVGVGFREDGALMYVTSGADRLIYEYLLTTPWDTATNEFQGTFEPLPNDTTQSLRGVSVSTYNHKFYMADQINDQIVECDFGLTVGGRIISDSPNIVEILTIDDLEANAVSDVWTISADTTLDWKGDIAGNVRFSIDSGVTLHITGGNRATSKYTYDGGDTTTCFSGAGALRMFGMKNWDCDINSQGATLVNLTGGGTLNIRDCLNVTEWVLGSSNGQVFGIDSVFVNVVNGFDFTNPTLINITDWAIEGNTLGADFISVITNDPASICNFTDISGLSLSSSGALFNFSGKSNNNARFSVKNCKVAKDNDGLAIGNLFEQNASGTGTVTAVAEGTISNGTITAQADNGSSGTTHSCTTTYFEDEEVFISGTTNYNGTFQIFNVVAGVSFDTITAFVANDATGSVGSDRLTVTLSGGHPIAATDDLKWTDGNFYNGFYTALNVVTNTLTLNGVFVGTDTGTLDDDVGLDQSDPRVVAIGNSPFVDSHYIATGFVNNNSTANGTIVNNTFTDMVFGTAGNALTAGTTMERWRLIDELNGTFEYFGNEPFDGDITFDFTVTSSGGTVEFRFKWEIDTGSGFADLPDPVEALIDVASNTRSVSKTFPLAGNKGDQIKPQITRNSGSSSITTSYATIYASQ